MFRFANRRAVPEGLGLSNGQKLMPNSHLASKCAVYCMFVQFIDTPPPLC